MRLAPPFQKSRSSPWESIPAPCIMCVQYIGRRSVHRGTLSTSGNVQYIGGCSVHREDTMSTSGDIVMHVGDIMSTLGDIQYIGGYHEYIGGYHEYIWGCSVHRGILLCMWGEQVGKNLSISIENPNVLNIPQCTHDIPRCTHGIPTCIMISWDFPKVLLLFQIGRKSLVEYKWLWLHTTRKSLQGLSFIIDNQTV